MFKKIENFISRQRNTSLSSQSTNSSNSSQTNKSSWSLLKTSSSNMAFEQPPLENMIMDLKLTKLNSRLLSQYQCDDKTKTSNPAVDPYQGLIAMGDRHGCIDIFDLSGNRKTRVTNIGNNKPITSVTFFPNRSFLMCFDIMNAPILVNYLTNESKILADPLFMDDQFTKISIPEAFEESNDFAYIGTDKGDIYIFQLKQQQFVSDLKNPLKDKNLQIVDIKFHPKKSHRLLITYKSQKDNSSSVIVYSLHSNKIVQKYQFNPTAYQELGQVISATFSPDAENIAMVFYSGKILIFKSNKKSTKHLPLQQLELDSSHQLMGAKISWKKLPNGNQCLFILSTFVIRKQVERQIQLYLSKDKKILFKACHNIDLLETGQQIQDSVFCDMMINNQNETITEMLSDQLKMSSKQFNKLLLRPSKQITLKCSLILTLSSNNKVSYIDPQTISEQRQPNLQQLTSLYQIQQSKTMQQVVLIKSKKDQLFSSYLEDLSLLCRKEQLLSVYQQQFGQFSKNEKYANQLEIEAYLTNIPQIDNKSLIGYIFEVDEHQMLSIGRIEKCRILNIIMINLSQFLAQDHVTCINVDKTHNRILFSTGNSFIYQLMKTQPESKKDKDQISSITLQQLNIKSSEGQEAITVSKTVLFNGKQQLQVQGFSNGKLKIVNLRTSKSLLNLYCTTDQGSKITAIQEVEKDDKMFIYVGTSNGYLSQVTISTKDIKVSKSKLISSFGIVQILASVPNSNQMIYALTKKSIICLDQQTFSIKMQYDLDPQKHSPKDSFKSFSYIKISEQQYSFVVHLNNKNLLLLIDTLTFICYCVYDLNKMGLMSNKGSIHQIDNNDHTFISIGNNITIFTLKKNLPVEYDEHQMTDVFNDHIDTKKLAKSDKKSLISSLFSKKINVEKCIEKSVKKQKVRSLSVGADALSKQIRQINFEEEKQSSKRSRREPEYIEGYRILARNTQKNTDQNIGKLRNYQKRKSRMVEQVEEEEIQEATSKKVRSKTNTSRKRKSMII